MNNVFIFIFGVYQDDIHKLIKILFIRSIKATEALVRPKGITLNS